ncbi:hypothetical protein CIB48_g11093 [Xylaria polymorpha]|nr:hypothetical protein CIB48_g11093 [Xylaria polymorpha]
MAPKFNFKEIRRRSLASFRTSRSTDTSSNDEPLSSSQEISSDQTQHHLASSQYAPQVTSIRDKSTVYQKVLLVTGVIGQDPHPQIDGTVLVYRPDKAFPSTSWPVQGARFKALIYLFPGPNTICFEYRRSGTIVTHRSSIVLYMFDPKNAPPLQLAIVVAKDSPFAIDYVPPHEWEEVSDLEVAIRKFRMAAYLWQSFTAEQMEKNGLGRRTFRFDEEWTNGTSHARDFHEHVMRSEARVHIVRTDKTVAEMRDLDCVQKDPGTPKKNSLVDITANALRDYFRMTPGQKQYVATLVLDPHPDTKENMTTDHTVFGGEAGDGLHLAMFGSQCLQYYPTNISDVVKAFRDCSPTDVKIVANEANVTGSSWEAATYGIGAHLREVGHLLGSPCQEKGIMAKDFVTLNRAFMIREAYSTRTKSKGGPVEAKDEPTWHRLDLLRYRFHPLFQNATDKTPFPDGTVHGWVVEKDKLLVTTGAGLLYTEIFAEGDEFCSTWIEYPLDGHMTKRTTLIEAELRERLPEAKRRSKLKIIVRSMSGGELVVDDFHQLCTNSSVKLTSGPLGKVAYRSTKIGASQLKDSEPQEVVFSNAVASINRILVRVTVYHGDAVDGLEFHYDDGSSQLLGKRGGKPGGDRFSMEIHNAEVIVGFTVRVGSWIDAIQIITSTGRRSPFYGNMKGGSPRTLFVPNGYKICGVSGSCADWLDSLSLLITR